MKVKREWVNYKREKIVRTDAELIEEFLLGYVDYYSGGDLEHMKKELANLRNQTAEALLIIGGDKLIAEIEE